MRKKVRFILAALIIALIGSFAAYTAVKPFETDLYQVVKKDASLYFTEQGVVSGLHKVSVYPLTQGEVTAVLVEENQMVQKGDILCLIDATNFEVQRSLLESEIRGYEAQITNIGLTEKQEKDNRRISLTSLEGELSALYAKETDVNLSREEQERLQHILINQSRSELSYQAQELEKAQVLFDEGIMAKSEYDVFLSSYNTAQSALEAEIKRLDIIENGEVGSSAEYMNNAKISLQNQIDGINKYLNNSYTSGMNQYYHALIQSARKQQELTEKQINDCIVRAPVDGEIISLNVKDANVVSSQMPIAVISAEEENEIELYVSTKDITDIHLNDAVTVTFKKQSGDVTFNGRVKFIDNEATKMLSALGVEERRVKVLVEPESNTVIDLKNGYDVLVKFTTYEEKDALTLPKTALYEYDGKDYVFIVKNGVVSEREVSLGVELRTEYIINSGIEEKDIVIKDVDIQGIKEGMRIKIDD